MSGHRYVVVDVFTERALEGNQLAVFTDAATSTSETMQSLALEVGFLGDDVRASARGGGTVAFRIFTPWTELPFAGHPRLGTAWVLAPRSCAGCSSSRRKAAWCPVELERDASGSIVFGRMEPAAAQRRSRTLDSEALFAALGIEAPRPAGRALRQRPPAHLRHSRLGGRRSSTPARLRRARGALA